MFENINQIQSLFTIETNLKKEYTMMIYDILRLSSIIIVINLLFYLQNPNEKSFFSNYFCKMLLAVIFGSAVFWLVIIKLVSIKSSKELKKENMEDVESENENSDNDNNNDNNDDLDEDDESDDDSEDSDSDDEINELRSY